LPSASLLALLVALVLTITSWIGYHNSANRAHFKLQFINVELTKFCLDIAMVVIYYVVAANASRLSPDLAFETRLIAIAFGLYIFWDLAGAYQKRKKSSWWSTGDVNPYYREWETVRESEERKDVLEDEKWTETNWARIWVTFGAFVAVAVLYAVVQLKFPGHNDTATAVAIGSILLVILLLYRIVKELPSGGSVKTGIPPQAGV
jgi:hypothetical protein